MRRYSVAGPLTNVGKTTLLAAMRFAVRTSRASASCLFAAGTDRARRYRDARRGPRTQRRRSRPRAHAGRVTWNRSRPAAPNPAHSSLLQGEARKLAMAYDGLGRQVWAMVLDEPTNHLDMPAIERLEEALVAVPRRDGDSNPRRRPRPQMHVRRVAALDGRRVDVR